MNFMRSAFSSALQRISRRFACAANVPFNENLLLQTAFQSWVMAWRFARICGLPCSTQFQFTRSIGANLLLKPSQQ
jgi:hypothetical protein